MINKTNRLTKEWELNKLYILTCFFVRLRPCSDSYVACYAPVATQTKTNKKSARKCTTYSTPIPKQSGVVLVVSLVMLLLLTLIALTGMQTTGLEEKMVTNMRDNNIAFQAAEAALRDAEKDLLAGRPSITAFDASCTNGLCYTGQNGIANIWDDGNKVANAVSYGANTNTIAIPVPPITDVIAQPRYLITAFKVQIPGAASGWKYMYQITAIAQGGQSTTQSILTEVYAP